MFLVAFAIIVNLIGQHFWGAGTLTALQIVLDGSAPGILEVLAYIWNGLVSIIAMIAFQIPGLEAVSTFTDAMIAWIVFRMIRGN